MSIRDYLLESDNKIGKTIIAQIKAQDKYAFAAWGTRDQVFTSNGLQFDVTGSKHKGRVIIGLDKGRDLYNIEIGKIVSGMNWKSIKKIKGIQVGNLVQALDDLIG
jgi:hypothetical protein